MFTEPPAFIRPLWYALADVTGWFNWDALAAIGTVGALWFAVVQSSRSSRSERARQVGTLTTLIQSTDALLGFPLGIWRRTEDGTYSTDQLQAIERAVEAIVLSLDKFPVMDVTEAGILTEFDQMKSAMIAAQYWFKNRIGSQSMLHGQIDRARAIQTRWRRERAFLMDGRIGVLVSDLLVQWRYWVIRRQLDRL